MCISKKKLSIFFLLPTMIIATFAIESIAGQGLDLGVVRLDHREYNTGAWRVEAGQTAQRKRLDIGVAQLDADEYRLATDPAPPMVMAHARPTVDCGVVRIDLEDVLDLQSRIRQTMDMQKRNWNKGSFLATRIFDAIRQP